MASAPENSMAAIGAARRICLTLLCALSVSLALHAACARAEREFGNYGTGAGQFIEPNGIAVDQRTGEVYVMDSNNERVEKFTSEGTFLLGWGWGVAGGGMPGLQVCTILTGCRAGLSGVGAGEFGFAEGLAVDSDPHSASVHDVYVTDIDSYRVEKFSPSGGFLLMFGAGVNASARARGEVSSEDVCPVRRGDRCGAGVPGSGDGQFDFRVEGDFIAVGSTGVVYVGDHNRVQEFSPDGVYLGQISLVPVVAGEGEAGGTLALAVNAQGDLYVIRYGISGVQEYTPRGALVQTIDGEAAPERNESPTPSLTVDPRGDLFLDYRMVEQSGVELHHMLEYGPSGSLLASFDAGKPDGLHGLAFGDALDRLYVVAAVADMADYMRVRILEPPAPVSPLLPSFSLLPWPF